MGTCGNSNFKSICVYDGINEDDLKKYVNSFHAAKRRDRMNVVKSLESNPVIDRCFVVDKGHRNGSELHAVTKGGMIYIYNLMKLFSKLDYALVTVLIARPNQIRRLYEACNLTVDKGIIDNARIHTKMNLNCV